MSYTITAIINGEEYSEKADTYAEAVEKYRKIELDNIFSRFVDSIQITRDRDNLLMFDSTHDYHLQIYETLSADKWDSSTFFYYAKSDKPSVYFDVDGTLAYWHNDGKGLSYPEQILDPTYHYYRDLEPHSFLVDLAKRLLDEGIDVCILTATDRYCFSDRWTWIENNLSFLPKENIFMCPIGSDKSNFCKGNAEISILIDDFEKNLSEWKGLPVKSVNSINSPSKQFYNIPTFQNEKIKSESEYKNAIDKYVSEIKECLQELEKCKDEFFISEVSESGIENQYFVDFNLPKEEIKNITSLLSIDEDEKIQIYGYVDAKDATFKIFESHIKGFEETENEISKIISKECLDTIKESLEEKFGMEFELYRSDDYEYG